MQVLYTALNANHEATVITDDVFRIQYANKAAERLFDIKVVRIQKLISNGLVCAILIKYVLLLNCFFIIER